MPLLMAALSSSSTDELVPPPRDILEILIIKNNTYCCIHELLIVTHLTTVGFAGLKLLATQLMAAITVLQLTKIIVIILLLSRSQLK